MRVSFVCVSFGSDDEDFYEIEDSGGCEGNKNMFSFYDNRKQPETSWERLEFKFSDIQASQVSVI